MLEVLSSEREKHIGKRVELNHFDQKDNGLLANTKTPDGERVILFPSDVIRVENSVVTL